MRREWLVVLLAAGASVPAAAQSADPLPRAVVDVRGVLVGLPTAAGWTPSLASAVQVPSRTLGVGADAHVRLGASSLMLGASVSTGSGSSSPELAGTGSTTSAIRSISTRLTTLSPQLSLNFGRRLGWSYVSAGFGAARVSSRATTTGAALEVLPSWSPALNFGGGARWFLTERVGLGFDLRWHRLSGRAAGPQRPAAPADTLLLLGVGLSLQGSRQESR